MPPISAAADGWSVFEDDEFRVSVPSTTNMVMRSTHSWTDGYPEFVIRHKDSTSRIGTGSFSPYDRHPGMLIRDAAEAGLKETLAAGGKVLVGVKVIPMRAGSCAVYTSVSGLYCSDPGSDYCGDHGLLAHCDSPHKKKRYVFIGNLGNTGSVDKRPPGFAENVANFERILRSIEFKKR